MAEILMDRFQDGPWILDELPLHRNTSISSHGLQFRGCIHQISHEISQSTAKLPLGPLYPSLISPGAQFDEFKCSIQGLCGLGGVVPFSRNFEDWDGVIQTHSRGCSVSYRFSHEVLEIGHASVVGRIPSRIERALRRVLEAIGMAQEQGLCCDSFTVLVRRNNGNPPWSLIELHRIKIKPALTLLGGLDDILSRIGDPSELGKMYEEERHSIMNLALELLGPLNMSPFKQYQAHYFSSLTFCSIAIQFFSLGFLSYLQGHCGKPRPAFLDRALATITLTELGSTGPLVIGSQARLSCLHDMIEEPVFVFRVAVHTEIERDLP